MFQALFLLFLFDSRKYLLPESTFGYEICNQHVDLGFSDDCGLVVWSRNPQALATIGCRL